MMSYLRRWRCRAMAPQLVEAAEGTLAAAASARLERHLARCADCRADLEALREVPALLRAAPEPEPSGSWERQRHDILRAVRLAADEPRRRTSIGWRLPVSVAAVAGALAISLAVLRTPPAPTTGAAGSDRAVSIGAPAAADVAALLPGDEVWWDDYADRSTDELLDEAPWLLSAAGSAAETREGETLPPEEIEAFDDMVGSWLVS